jgi:hypothetical protein
LKTLFSLSLNKLARLSLARFFKASLIFGD